MVGISFLAVILVQFAPHNLLSVTHSAPPPLELEIEFTDPKSAFPGMPVLLRGEKIGEVVAVNVLEEREAPIKGDPTRFHYQARLNIHSSAKSFKDTNTVAIATSLQYNGTPKRIIKLISSPLKSEKLAFNSRSVTGFSSYEEFWGSH